MGGVTGPGFLEPISLSVKGLNRQRKLRVAVMVRKLGDCYKK